MKYSVGKGWWVHIDEIIPKLEALGVKKIYPYQKYGTLRIDVDYETPEITEIIEKLEDKSSVICEECGEPGKERTIDDWISTLCDYCYSQRLLDRKINGKYKR